MLLKKRIYGDMVAGVEELCGIAPEFSEIIAVTDSAREVFESCT